MAALLNKVAIFTLAAVTLAFTLSKLAEVNATVCLDPSANITPPPPAAVNTMSLASKVTRLPIVVDPTGVVHTSIWLPCAIVVCVSAFTKSIRMVEIEEKPALLCGFAPILLMMSPLKVCDAVSTLPLA